jgi:hypothetical protein
MKKVLVFVMMMLCFSGVSVFAAEPSSFPSSVEPGNIIANVGIGLSHSLALRYRGTQVVLPLSLSVEYALPISIPISVGAVIGFTSSERTSGSGDGEYTFSWSVFSIGAKVAYHFNWAIQNLDTYLGLTLGGNVISAHPAEYNASYYQDYTVKPSSGDNGGNFLFGLEVGARFFFNPNIGIFIEEGFNTFTYLRSGLVFKF